MTNSAVAKRQGHSNPHVTLGDTARDQSEPTLENTRRWHARLEQEKQEQKHANEKDKKAKCSRKRKRSDGVKNDEPQSHHTPALTADTRLDPASSHAPAEFFTASPNQKIKKCPAKPSTTAGASTAQDSRFDAGAPLEFEDITIRDPKLEEMSQVASQSFNVTRRCMTNLQEVLRVCGTSTDANVRRLAPPRKGISLAYRGRKNSMRSARRHSN